MVHVVRVTAVCSLMIQSQSLPWSASITSLAAVHMALGVGKLDARIILLWNSLFW